MPRAQTGNACVTQISRTVGLSSITHCHRAQGVLRVVPMSPVPRHWLQILQLAIESVLGSRVELYQAILLLKVRISSETARAQTSVPAHNFQPHRWDLCGCSSDPRKSGSPAVTVPWLLTVRPCCNKACHEILLRSVQVVTET